MRVAEHFNICSLVLVGMLWIINIVLKVLAGKVPSSLVEDKGFGLFLKLLEHSLMIQANLILSISAYTGPNSNLSPLKFQFLCC